MKRFWVWLCRLAYRRATTGPSRKEPVGLPRRRDPENRCEAYEPRACEPGDWRDCDTDGHYLCEECCHRAPESEEESE
jgi:hypothetical protein